MRVLYLFNKVLGETVEEAKSGISHDSWLFGMLRLPRYSIETGFLEIEKYIPIALAKFLRKYILTMHYAHIPLFPLFFSYDIVFTSTAFGSLFLKALFRIKKFKWVILDFNIMGTLQEEKTFKQKIFAWSIAHGVDGIIAISQAEANALKKRFPHFAPKIIFIYEATDINFFKPRPQIKMKNQIISVGNYARDFETIIEAIKKIDIELLIVGKFSEDKIKTLPTYVKVVQLDHREIVKAYAESRIAVISLKTKDSYSDSVGTLSLGEAMAMGKPIIVTRTKNMESYIQDWVNGVLVKDGNVEEMRQAIIDILSNKEKSTQLGSCAREFALKNLDSDIFAQRLAFFLKTMI